MSALGRRGEETSLGPEDMEVEFLQRRLREVFQCERDLPGLRVDPRGACQLDVGREAVGREDEPVRIVRFRLRQVDRPGYRPRQCRDVEVSVAIFEFSGQLAPKQGADAGASSGQATFPSAAFGLIVNPSGSVTSEVRSSDGAGTLPLWDCGTLIVRSSPEAVSERSVVGFARKLGEKLSC